MENIFCIDLRPGGEDLHYVGWLSLEEIMGRREEFEKWSILAARLAAAAPRPASATLHIWPETAKRV